MNHYVLRKVNGEVRHHFVADIISTDAGMALFYINGSEGPELTAAIKLGVGDIVEGEGALFPAYDKVKIESTLKGGFEYVEVEELVMRFNNIRGSLLRHQDYLEQAQAREHALKNTVKTQSRVIQNLSDINKQLEDHNVIKDPAYFGAPKWNTDITSHPPQEQVTSGQANNQSQVPGAQSRFELDRECEDFFRDND